MSAPESQQCAIESIQRLLGAVALLPCKGKKPTRKGWPKVTATEMDPSYLHRLKGSNIGINLGGPSGGLCAIDIDDEAFVAPFLAANPELGKTFQTRGNRGRVFWLRFCGAYPRKSSELRSRAKAKVGEFRSNGNQAVVWGIHPESRRPYRWLVVCPALTVEFSQIKWPEQIIPPALQINTNVEKTLSSSPYNPVEELLSEIGSPMSIPSVGEAVALALPLASRRNNAALFKLARALKAVETTRGRRLTGEERLAAFDLWYAQTKSRGFLRHGREHYLIKLQNAMICAKTPLCLSPLEKALNLARTEPLSPEVEGVLDRVPAISREAELLIQLCWNLHRTSQPAYWFMSSRSLARLIGTWSHVTYANWVATLVSLGVLEVVEHATKWKAPRYRWVTAAQASSAVAEKPTKTAKL